MDQIRFWIRLALSIAAGAVLACAQPSNLPGVQVLPLRPDISLPANFRYAGVAVSELLGSSLDELPEMAFQQQLKSVFSTREQLEGYFDGKVQKPEISSPCTIEGVLRKDNERYEALLTLRDKSVRVVLDLPELVDFRRKALEAVIASSCGAKKIPVESLWKESLPAGALASFGALMLENAYRAKGLSSDTKPISQLAKENPGSFLVSYAFLNVLVGDGNLPAARTQIEALRRLRSGVALLPILAVFEEEDSNPAFETLSSLAVERGLSEPSTTLADIALFRFGIHSLNKPTERVLAIRNTALRQLDQLAKEAEKGGDPVLAARSNAYFVLIETAGDQAPAEESLKKRAARAIQNRQHLSDANSFTIRATIAVRYWWARALVDQGKLAEAGTELYGALETARSGDEKHWLNELHFLIGNLHLQEQQVAIANFKGNRAYLSFNQAINSPGNEARHNFLQAALAARALNKPLEEGNALLMAERGAGSSGTGTLGSALQLLQKADSIEGIVEALVSIISKDCQPVQDRILLSSLSSDPAQKQQELDNVRRSCAASLAQLESSANRLSNADRVRYATAHYWLAWGWLAIGNAEKSEQFGEKLLQTLRTGKSNPNDLSEAKLLLARAKLSNGKSTKEVFPLVSEAADSTPSALTWEQWLIVARVRTEAREYKKANAALSSCVRAYFDRGATKSVFIGVPSAVALAYADLAAERKFRDAEGVWLVRSLAQCSIAECAIVMDRLADFEELSGRSSNELVLRKMAIENLIAGCSEELSPEGAYQCKDALGRLVARTAHSLLAFDRAPQAISLVENATMWSDDLKRLGMISRISGLTYGDRERPIREAVEKWTTAIQEISRQQSPSNTSEALVELYEKWLTSTDPQLAKLQAISGGMPDGNTIAKSNLNPLTGPQPKVARVLVFFANGAVSSAAYVGSQWKVAAAKTSEESFRANVEDAFECLAKVQEVSCLSELQALRGIVLTDAIQEFLKIRGVDEIEWVGWGNTRFLPFNALYDGRQFLVEKFSSSIHNSGNTRSFYIDKPSVGSAVDELLLSSTKTATVAWATYNANAVGDGRWRLRKDDDPDSATDGQTQQEIAIGLRIRAPISPEDQKLLDALPDPGNGFEAHLTVLQSLLSDQPNYNGANSPKASRASMSEEFMAAFGYVGGDILLSRETGTNDPFLSRFLHFRKSGLSRASALRAAQLELIPAKGDRSARLGEWAYRFLFTSGDRR